MLNRIFVYGSLRRGYDNRYAQLLHANATFLGEARMRGRKVQAGEYLGMKGALTAEDWVEGEIFEMHNAQTLLPQLDSYEGEEYERRPQMAALADRRELECWVYLYLL